MTEALVTATTDEKQIERARQAGEDIRKVSSYFSDCHFLAHTDFLDCIDRRTESPALSNVSTEISNTPSRSYQNPPTSRRRSATRLVMPRMKMLEISQSQSQRTSTVPTDSQRRRLRAMPDPSETIRNLTQRRTRRRRGNEGRAREARQRERGVKRRARRTNGIT